MCGNGDVIFIALQRKSPFTLCSRLYNRSEYSCNKYVNRVEWGFLIGLIFVMPLDHIKPRVKINK